MAQVDPKAVANPGRPTVSTPATLTPIGYLQFENGALGATESPEFSTRVSINQVTKLTVASRLQLLLITEPFVRSREESQKEIHPGDVFGGFQAVLVPGKNKRPTISASYFRHFYASAAPDFDIGSYRQGGIILVSTDLGGFHFDANAMFNQQTEERQSRVQFGQTLSVSHPWNGWTISGEIWHFTQPFTKSDAVGNLWAASRAIRPNLVIDFGYQHGFTNTSTRWEAFAGFTYVLPYRLWKQ